MKRFLRIFFSIILFLIPSTIKPKIDAQPGMSTWTILQQLSLVSDNTTAIPVRNSDEVGNIITLNTSGNYQLVENIIYPILIADNDICLNLNCYKVSSIDGNTNLITVNSGLTRVYIHNGHLVNTDSPTGSGSGVLVSNSCSNIRLENLSATGCGTGVKLAGLESGEVIECELVALDLVSNNKAVELVHADKNIIERCHAVGSSRAGFLLRLSNYNQLNNCDATKTHNTNAIGDAQGFVTDSGKGNIFQDCTAEDSFKGALGNATTVATGFTLARTEYDTKIINCLVNTVTTLGDSISYGYLIKPGDQLDPAGTSGDPGITVIDVSWTSDGKYLAVALQSSSQVRIYEYNSIAETLTHKTNLSILSAINAVSWRPGVYGTPPNERYYLAIGANKNPPPFTFNNLATLEYIPLANSITVLNAVLFVGNYTVKDIDWESSGSYCAVAGENRLGVYNWDLTGPFDSYIGSGAYEAVAFSPNGSWITIGGSSGGVGTLQAFNYSGPPSGATLSPSANLWPLLQDNANPDLDETLSLDASANSQYLAVGLGISGAVTSALQILGYNGGSWQLAAYSTDHNADINSVSWASQTSAPYNLVTGGDVWNKPTYRIRKFEFDEWSTLSEMDKEAHNATLNAVDWSAQGGFVTSGGASDGGTYLRVFKDIAFEPVCNCLLKNNIAMNCGYGFAGGFINNRAIQNIAYNNGVNYSGVPNVYTYDPTGADNAGVMENVELL